MGGDLEGGMAHIQGGGGSIIERDMGGVKRDNKLLCGRDKERECVQ